MHAQAQGLLQGPGMPLTLTLIHSPRLGIPKASKGAMRGRQVRTEADAPVLLHWC